MYERFNDYGVNVWWRETRNMRRLQVEMAIKK